MTHLEQLKAMLYAVGIKHRTVVNTDDYGEDDGTLGGTMVTVRGSGDPFDTHWNFHKDGRLLFVTNMEADESWSGEEYVGLSESASE